MLDGHSAGLLLVAAHTGGFARSRTLLFLVRGGRAPGSSGPGRPRWTRPGRRPVSNCGTPPAELLGEDDAADVPGRAGRRRAGRRRRARRRGGRRGRRSALDRTRGVRPGSASSSAGAIGSFQAVKHRLADLYVQRPGGPLGGVLRGLGPGRGRAALALAQAWRRCGSAAGEAVQLHGGIGFTWEHEAHLYFKRAAADELLFGPVHRLRAHAAERAGLFARRARRWRSDGCPASGWCRRSPRPVPSRRSRRTSSRRGPYGAPADPRQGAAQRADAAGGDPHRPGREERAAAGTPLACMPEEDGRLAPDRLQLRPPGSPGLDGNLLAHPDAEVSWKGRDIAVRARLLEGEEREAVWQAALTFWPPYATYQARIEREIRLFRLERR